MALTEEQLREAEAELQRRAKQRSDEYSATYARAMREAEERHWVKMEAAYPGINRETLYSIYSDMREYYE